MTCKPRCDAGTVCEWKAGATIKTEFECVKTQFPTTKTECEKIDEAQWIAEPTGRCQCKNASHYYFKDNNRCFPKSTCDPNSHTPMYDSRGNSCYACTDNKKPKYNKEKDECEACPTETPVYFYEALKCIKKEECKTENDQEYVASDNQCRCLGTTEYKNNKCVPRCLPACQAGQVCQFKKGGKTDTECVAPTPVCKPECKSGQKCQFKKGSTTETECVANNGVNGLFFILGLVIFFLF